MDEAWFYLQGVQIGHLKFKVIINGNLNIIMYLYFEHWKSKGFVWKAYKESEMNCCLSHERQSFNASEKS